MKPQIFGALFGIITASLGGAEGLLKQPGQWIPFVERLEKDEFLAVEHALGGTLSDEKPDLIIYNSAGRSIWTSLVVTRMADGTYRLETIVRRGPSEPTRKAIKLPAEIAIKLLATMQLCLTKQLYPPTGHAYLYPSTQNTFQGAYWINLQIDKSTAIGGVVLRERCYFEHNSVFPFLDVVDQLTSSAEARDAPSDSLARLDHSIYLLQSSYPTER
jgi:hypothetical protein